MEPAPRIFSPASERVVFNETITRKAAALTTLLLAGGVNHAWADDLVAANAVSKTLPGIVVTENAATSLEAPKSNTPLVDTPQSITVIPQNIIQEQGAISLSDILRNSPGITFQAGEGGTPAGDQMTIRGFSARTDLFIDGVRDLGGYARDAYNIEQVEVAQGPSSVSSGRGSTGGSVNLVTKKPHAGTARSVAVSAGTADYRRATADINQPLDDTKAVRVNLMATRADVPGRNVVRNSSWGAAPSLAFGLDRPTKLILAWQHLQQDNIPDYGLPQQVFAYQPPVSYSNWYGLKARDYEKIKQDLFTAIIEHRAAGNLRLRNLTRYGRTSRDSVITAPRFVNGSTTVVRRSDWKSRDQTDEILANQTQLDLDVMLGTVAHALSAGLELSRESEINYNRVEAPGVVLPDTNVYAPDPDAPYHGRITRDGAYVRGTGDTASLYVFDNIFAGRRWQLFTGLRYDIFAAQQDSVDAAQARVTEARTDHALSGRFGIIFKPTDRSSLYADFANSFNPSADGLTLSTSRTDLSDVAPEQTNTYEIGAKWNARQGRLFLTAALFRTEKTNARTPGLNPSDPPIVLDGRERVQGLELSAAGRLSSAWEIFAGLALMDSDVLASNTAGLAGAALGLTPKTTFNLWTTYRLPFGLTLGGGARYMDSVYRNTAVNAQRIPDYWLFSAMLSYPFNQTVSLRLNADNLLDKRYIGRVGGGHHIPGPARQIILTANFAF